MILAFAVLMVQVGIGVVLLTNIIWMMREKRRGVTVQAVGAGSVQRISVIVPARNEADNLRRLLPSLLSQGHSDFEVIVYDDNSDDATWDVIGSFADRRLRGMRGDGPPEGWVGKVHALYAATRDVDGDVILFLDADAELRGDGALERLAARFGSLPEGSVLSGLTRLHGGAPLLVSLVPFTILGFLPIPLTARLSQRTLGALNGQCWMIERSVYARYEPHLRCRSEVLEDVEIGRYLKGEGITPWLLDLQGEVAVYMYTGFAEAWRGFRKNAYLLMGGRAYRFWPLFLFFCTVLVLPWLISPWLLIGAIVLKLASDGFGRFPIWVSALAPVSFLLAAVLQLDSAVHHWLGRVSWKGRRVGASQA